MEFDLLQHLIGNAQLPVDPQFIPELREETHILPSICGLPRIIRAFPPSPAPIQGK